MSTQAKLFVEDIQTAGKRVIVTSGPTHEPIDPVRYIANRSSGKQGHAIAAAAAAAGAEVVLISGPVDVPDPIGTKVTKVETARDMLRAVEAALPADVAIFTAAVADWRMAEPSSQKIKKSGKAAPELALVENPDILGAVAALPQPPFCVGFAAESNDLLANASAKRLKKKVPLIVANLGPATFGADDNALTLIDERGVRELARAGKLALARQLVAEIAARIAAVPARAKAKASA